MTKAVLGISSSFILICQNPESRSKLLNSREPASISSVSSILGNGYLSGTVILFSFLKSVQNLKVPSFFLASVTGAENGDRDG